MHFSGGFGGFRAGAASGAGRRQRGVFRRISGVLQRFCNRLFPLFMRLRRRFFASSCNFQAQKGRIFRGNRRPAASHGVRSAAGASGVWAFPRRKFFQRVSAECFAHSHFRRPRLCSCGLRKREAKTRDSRPSHASRPLRPAFLLRVVPAAKFFQRVSAKCFADSHFRRPRLCSCGLRRREAKTRDSRPSHASRGVRRSCCAFLAENETKKPAGAFPFPRAASMQCFLFPLERATPRPTKFYSSKNGGAGKL